MIATAIPLAWLTLRGVQVPVAVPRAAVAAHPPLGGEGWAGSLQRNFHLPTWHGCTTLLGRLRTPFMRLQIFWFAAFMMIGAVMSMFPLALVRTFGVGDGFPATTYAFAAGASLTLYPTAVRLARSQGAHRLLRAGLMIRTVAIAMVAAAFLSDVHAVTLASAGFVILVLTWPLLGVSGTVLSAQLCHGEKGEALGVFNALTALSSAAGAFFGGCAMEIGGYGAVCVAGSVVVAIAAMWATSAQPDAKCA
jgi:predicted MFS family arabinose efflux permease